MNKTWSLENKLAFGKLSLTLSRRAAPFGTVKMYRLKDLVIQFIFGLLQKFYIKLKL